MKKPLHNFIIFIGYTIPLYLLLFTSSAQAQHFIFGNEKTKIEVGVNFGPTFFLGDLGGNRGRGTTFVKDVNFELTKIMKGAFIGFYPSEWLGFRIAAQQTYLEGKDDLIDVKGGLEIFRKERNLNFKTNMFEAYAAVELYPLMLLNNQNPDYTPRYRPYGFIGVGMFTFNPKGSLTDQNGNVTWHELAPLHTEGQGFAEYPNRKNYSLTQLNIPMGGGIKYMVSDKVTMAVELLYRKTFTDYIDDVSTEYIDPNLFDKYLSVSDANIARQINDKTFTSYVPGSSRFTAGTQRGNPKNNDAYFSFVLKLGVRLGDTYASTSARMYAGKTRCPERF